MATIYEYLDKKRQEEPFYKNYSYSSLYKSLKGSDPNLPKWEAVDQSLQEQQKDLKFYEQEQNPSFVNSLFEWSDYTIDESSAKWKKQAYNNSITGMAYQMYHGKQ